MMIGTHFFVVFLWVVLLIGVAVLVLWFGYRCALVIVDSSEKLLGPRRGPAVVIMLGVMGWAWVLTELLTGGR